MPFEQSMVSLSLVRYPRGYSGLGLLSMAFHRFPLWRNKSLRFYKLLGCGKGDSFDFHPDWRQWGILTVSPRFTTSFSHPDSISHSDILMSLYGKYISKWLRFFHCEVWTLVLEPIESKGSWDGKQPFDKVSAQKPIEPDEMIAIITRATIRARVLRRFWRHASHFNSKLAHTRGLLYSAGMGEMPVLKQATFSVWRNEEHMKAFAYQSEDHKEVIRKTRNEKWYAEELFARFRILKTWGSLNGKDPLLKDQQE